MVLGGLFRESVDKAAETCLVLDVVVSPSVIQECNADKSGETKEEVSLSRRLFVVMLVGVCSCYRCIARQREGAIPRWSAWRSTG